MRKSLVATAVLSLLLSLVSPPAMAEKTPPPPLFHSETPTEARSAPEGLDGTQAVIVLLKEQPASPGADTKAMTAAQRVLSRWEGSEGFKLRRQFGHLVGGFSATVPASRIRELAADPDVASVQKLKTYQPSMQTAGQLTRSVAARTNLGVDGAGTVISIIDTGIDPTHQDMRLDDGAARKLTPQGEHATEKVPYGWNYADENSNFVDTTSSMHGMHVAGIAAANGGPDADATTNGRINGIAPNAQLLAMKVFSNDPALNGAKEDDIIAAIEDSVKMGADIINMSLGSPNGTNESSIGQGRAIATAQAAGVQVIVAAGNEGLNGSSGGSDVDYSNMLDDGTMNTPASATDALAVASVDNSHSLISLARIRAGNDTLELPYKLQIGQVDGQEHGIVDTGLSRPEDFPANTSGNHVLIERGALSFADKFSNAVAAGATGVIIRNDAAGGDTFTSMSGLEEFTIPGAFMFHSVGQQLNQAITANGGIARITLTDQTRLVEISPSLRSSTFTSWGATPELDFKPQLAGIGGNVRSTINDNAYLEESGTSMAAPHVSGAFALALPTYREKYPDLSAVQRNHLLRTAFSNTAKILEHSPGQPYAPRQIGAGLIQTEAAITTEVFATVEGEPAVALRQIDGPRSFTVTLTNRGDHDRTFTAGSSCVVEESQQVGQPNTTRCSTTERLTSATSSVTVPAGGTATVDYTLTPTTDDRHWIQGWATFDATEETQPDLVVPYLGFVGDWNAEPIIDHPRGSGKTPVLDGLLGPEQPNVTSLVAPLGFLSLPTSWMSPNDDGFYDELIPAFALLRSAGDVEFEVLKDGEVVRSLGKVREQLRPTFATLPTSFFSGATEAPGNGWDGTLYNPATGEFEQLPDTSLGTYTFRIKARLSEDFDWQVTDLPVGIDTVTPEASYTVETGADGSRTYTVTATDDRSGLDDRFPVLAYDGIFGAPIEATPSGTDTYTFTIPAEMAGSDSYVDIEIRDRAGNISELRDFYHLRPLRVMQSPVLDRWVGSETEFYGAPEIIDGKVTLTLILAPEVTKATFNGNPVEIKDGKAQVQVPVSGGRNDYEFIAYSTSGQELGRATHWLGLDTTPPTLELTSIPLDARGRLILDPDGTVTISGRVTDDLAKPDDIAVRSGKDEVTVDAEGRFTHTFTPRNGLLVLEVMDHAAQLKEKDQITNTLVQTWFTTGSNPAGIPLIHFDDPALEDPGLSSRAFFVTSAFQNLEIINQDAGPGEVAARLTLKGKLTEKPNSFQIAGQEVPLDDDLRFSVPIDLVNGLTHVGYVMVGADGKRHERSWLFLYDRALPGLDLKMDPKPHADGAIYLPKSPADVTLSGEVWDNEFGYRLSVNGNVIEEFAKRLDTGADSRLPFKTTVPGLTDQQILNVLLVDQFSNGFEQRIPIVVDDQTPALALDGPKGATGPDAEFTVKVSDENLENLIVLIDDQQVATEVVAPVLHPKASYIELRQGEPVAQTAASGEKAETSKQITVRLKDVPDLAKGRHTLTAVATDKAGNTATAASVFVLDEAPTITGPDTLTVAAGQDPRQAIRENYQASDPEDGALELVFDATRLVPGRATELELSATDSAGNTVRRVVSITLEIRKPGTPEAPGLPGQPDRGKPQRPTKPVPPVKRPGLPRTGG